MSGIRVERVTVEEIIDLRHVVLRAGLARESAKFPGDDDPQAVHLAAKIGTKVIGCASILVNEWNGERACQLRGMAVDPVEQRRGVGRLLLAEIEVIAVEKKVRLLWANVRKVAVAFYQKCGWEIVSAEFEIPTAGPHFKMKKFLPPRR